MRNLLSIAILLSIATALPAQTIPITLSKKAGQPAAFELPDHNSAIFLFYQLKNGRLMLQARELNSSFEELRQTQGSELPDNLGQIAYVCGALNDSVLTAFFLIDESKLWRMQLHLQDFSLQFQKARSLRDREECLGGFAQAGNYFVVSRWLESKNKALLSIYENPGMANAQLRSIDLEGDIRLCAKKYNPYWTDPNVELSPEVAAGQDKIYYDAGHIWFSSDITVKNIANEAPAIELSTLSLQNYTLQTELITFDSLVSSRFGEKQKAAHCILDQKIFTLFYHKEQMHLRVQDLVSRSILWQESISASKDTISIFNSPLLLPGSVSYNHNKEYYTGKKFIPRFLKLDPFLQVRYDTLGYILSLGGLQPATNAGGGPVFMPGTPGIGTPYGNVPGTPGSWSGGRWGNWGGWGGSQSRSANFYVILHNTAVARTADAPQAPAFSASDVQFTNTFLGKISGFFGSVHDEADGIFHLFGKHYYGCYRKKDKAFRLFPLILKEQK